MKILLILIVVSFNSFASVCSTNENNLKFQDLDWFEITRYTVHSSVTDVNGILCLGFTSTKELKRVHYFDDLENAVLKDAKDLLQKDVIFFSKSILPSFVKALTRSADPLSIGIKKVSKDNYIVNIKFVENMMKGFRSTRIRLIPINMNFSSSRPVLSLRGKKFDDFFLNITNTIRISYLATSKNGVENQRFSTSEFKKVRRKL